MINSYFVIELVPCLYMCCTVKYKMLDNFGRTFLIFIALCATVGVDLFYLLKVVVQREMTTVYLYEQTSLLSRQ